MKRKFLHSFSLFLYKYSKLSLFILLQKEGKLEDTVGSFTGLSSFFYLRLSRRTEKVLRDKNGDKNACS